MLSVFLFLLNLVTTYRIGCCECPSLYPFASAVKLRQMDTPIERRTVSEFPTEFLLGDDHSRSGFFSLKAVSSLDLCSFPGP